MTASEKVHQIIKQAGFNDSDVAKELNISRQNLSDKMKRGTLRAETLFKIMDIIGVEVKFYKKSTGKEIREYIRGDGRPVKAYVDSKLYNTKTSDALANNFYSDGKNKYNDGRARELYIDREGNYFFAEYFEEEGKKDKINPISAYDAAEFISIYGTTIYKEPKE